MKKIHYLNIYSNRFLGDMVPVMPLLGLFLQDGGFTLSAVSLFFLCLAVTIVVVEIPAGILADKKNPRLVVVLSRLSKLLAFVVLYFATNIYLLCFSAFLWGVSTALDSGAMQSYLFRLARQWGDENSFELIYGKTFTASLLGLLAAGLIATQIDALGFAVLQSIGIIALGSCFVSVLFYPKLTEVVTEDLSGEEKVIHKGGLKNIIRLEPILILLLAIGIFAGGIKGSLDEYTTLLLANKELTLGAIGYVVFALEVLKTGGAAVAAKFKLSIKAQLFVLMILGLAFLSAAIGNYLVAVTSLVLVIFIDAILWVHNDTAIQRNASDENRATVASVKNFGTELIAGGVFLLAWIFGEGIDVTLIYKLGGIVLLLVATFLFFTQGRTAR